MKSFALFFISVLFLVSCFSFVSAVDIAYVVKYPSILDNNFIGAIDELGYSYDVIDDSDVGAVNFSNYEMILIGGGSLSNFRDIPIAEIGGLVASEKSSYIDNWGIADYTTELSSSNYDYGNILVRNMITGELISPVKLYNDKDAKMSLLPENSQDRARGLKKVVSAKNYNRVLIGTIDVGGELYGGGTASDRVVFFGITESDYWTTESRQMFKNSISWIMNEKDNDGDGYSGVEDCNDNDINIHPGAVEILDNVDQNCVNDAPVLVQDIRAIVLEENENNENVIDLYEYFKDPDGDDLVFSVHSITNDLDVTVSIENSLVSFDVGELDSNEKVVFKANDGNLDVLSNEVILSAGDLGSCSDLNGFSCSLGRVCGGNWLDFANTCCSVTCTFEETPDFGDVDRELDKLNGNINIDIRKPLDNAEFVPGRAIETRIEIENKLQEDLDFDVDIYLYDLDDDEVIESVGFSVNLENSERKNIDNIIEVEGDIDTSHNYAVLVTVIDEDGEYYNEDYVVIVLKREEHDVIIEKLEISPGAVSCGGYVTVRARVYNVGENDEEVYIRLKNTELGIDERSDEFSLERYDNDDTKIVEFRVEIPSGVADGEYVLRVASYFSGESEYLEGVLVVGGCEEGVENDIIDISNVESVGSINPVKVKKQGLGWQIGLLVTSFVVLVGLVVMLVVYRKNGYSS